MGHRSRSELDSFSPTEEPTWKVIVQVNEPANDHERLQATLTKLLALAPVKAQQSEEEGITYNTFQIPAGQKTRTISYAFADGFLIVGSSRELVGDAVHIHRSGESLAHSTKFLTALPAGQGAEASALLFENPSAFREDLYASGNTRHAGVVFSGAPESPQLVVCAYGDETTIREVSKSGGFDAGVIAAAAAIAIPNLLRARVAANESSAVAIIRLVNVAQITYSSTYPTRGFAPDLATLWPRSS